MKKKTWNCDPYTIELIENEELKCTLVVIGPVSNKNTIRVFENFFEGSLKMAEQFSTNAIQAVEHGYSILNRSFVHPKTESDIGFSIAFDTHPRAFGKLLK